MIDRAIQNLASHKFLNGLLVLGYVLFIVFAHEWFVNVSVKVMNGLSIPVYDRVVGTIAAVILMGLLLLIYRIFKGNSEFDRQGLLFFLATLAALVVHFFVFTEMNIEFIHAMEFGLLATLLYPLLGRYGAAVVFAFPIMLFDEWYQYQMLFDYVEYFDFNDIVLDLLGAGLFLSALKMWKVETVNPFKPISNRPEVYLLFGLLVVSVVMLLTTTAVPFKEQATDSTWLVLNEIQEEHGFWRVHPLIGNSYHVIQPVQGIMTVLAICSVYLGMDSIRPAK